MFNNRFFLHRAIRFQSATVVGVLVLCLVCAAMFLKMMVSSAGAETTGQNMVPVDAKDVPRIVGKILTPGEQVMGKISAPGNLTAWIIHHEADPRAMAVVYTSEDHRIMIHGRLFEEHADSLIEHTEQYLARLAPVINLDAQWERITGSHWLADGTDDARATRIVYGFFDANCVYCHFARLAMEPYMKQGLQVRWIPVAVIGESSGRKAAALFAAQDVGAAMAAGHAKWDEGGFEQARDVSQEIQGKLDQNAALMRALGVQGTPAFFYQDAQGRVQSVLGMPSLAMVATLAGMAYIENPDSKLQRFAQ